MRKIQNPNIGQITWALVPTLIFSVLYILTGSTYSWMLAIAIIGIIIYAVLATYFCVKQKCYRQLAFAYISAALYAAFVALIIYINKS